jgi:hypothetical protein
MHYLFGDLVDSYQVFLIVDTVTQGVAKTSETTTVSPISEHYQISDLLMLESSVNTIINNIDL